MSQMLLRHTEASPNAGVELSLSNFTANYCAELADPGGAAPPTGPWVAPEARRPTAQPGSLPVGAIPATEANAIQEDDLWTHILDFGERGYMVRQPLSVRIERIGIGECKASFREANIAISGTDTIDAYQALVADILDTFDALSEARLLSPAAAEQLRILREYIAKEEA